MTNLTDNTAIVASARDYLITYSKGLTFKINKKIVEDTRKNTTNYAVTALAAEQAMKDSFAKIVEAAKQQGLTRFQAGKVMAMILGVKTISSAHEDEAIAMTIKLRWQYAARDLMSSQNQTGNGRKDPKDKDVISTEKVESAKGASFEENLTNKKYTEVGALLGTRVKNVNERLELIMALLADATAEEVEAVAKAITAPHAKSVPTHPPKRTRKTTPKVQQPQLV